jgi:uncharacterized damage-inducible protein DinB
MNCKDFFLKHWQKEGPATHKVISRVPTDSCEYRSDPKARTAREIAWLMVREEEALVEGLERGRFEWAEAPPPEKFGDIVALYERQHDALTNRLEKIAGSRWEENLPFVFGGQEVMRDTGNEMAWGFLLDQIHHRGQLSTYLRPMGAKVPSIYGPSADEPM